jgi:hypothetical protein
MDMRQTICVEDLVVEHLEPRIYINGFPKSGTHLAYLMVSHLARPQEPKHSLGTFQDNCWSTRWANTAMVVDIAAHQPAGTWVWGHMGYRPEFDLVLHETGVSVIFVYRDLRDVAVSQTYHIEQDSEHFAHPDKEMFMDLGSHEARLLAVVAGYDKYPGLIERWELYAPWLNIDWVEKVRFEDMRQRPREVAEVVIPYIFHRTMAQADFTPLVLGDNYELAVSKAAELLQTTQYSSTYALSERPNKGKIGTWKDEFTPEIKEAFKERAGGWLKELGYEKSNDW